MKRLQVLFLLCFWLSEFAIAGYRIQVALTGQPARSVNVEPSGFLCQLVGSWPRLGLDGQGNLHVLPVGSGFDNHKPSGVFVKIGCAGSDMLALDTAGNLWRWNADTPASIHRTQVADIHGSVIFLRDGRTFVFGNTGDLELMLPPGERFRRSSGLAIVTESGKGYRLNPDGSVTLLRSGIRDGVNYHIGSSATERFMWLDSSGVLVEDPGIDFCDGADHLYMGYNRSGYLMCFFMDAGMVNVSGYFYYNRTYLRSAINFPVGSVLLDGQTAWPSIRTPDNKIYTVFADYLWLLFDFGADP